MKTKTISIQIHRNGEIKAETFGFSGPSCVDELNRLMKDLAEIELSQKKDEYFDSELVVKKGIVIRND